MRKIIVAVCALLLAGTAQAASTQSSKGASEAKTHRSVVGTVESVKGNTLTLKNEANQTRELEIGSHTRFMEHGKKISKKDVKEGSEVRASFRPASGGKLEATRITVMGAGSHSAGAKQTGEKSEGSGSSSQSGMRSSGTGSSGSGSSR